MFEKSEIKKAIIDVLVTWNYKQLRASPYNIAKKIGVSESSIIKILRYLKDKKIVAKSPGGSWRLL